jgi:hypothetical protein
MKSFKKAARRTNKQKNNALSKHMYRIHRNEFKKILAKILLKGKQIKIVKTQNSMCYALLLLPGMNAGCFSVLIVLRAEKKIYYQGTI